MTYANAIKNIELTNVRYGRSESVYHKEDRVVATTAHDGVSIVVEYKLGILIGKEEIGANSDDFEISKMKSVIASRIIRRFGDDSIE